MAPEKNDLVTVEITDIGESGEGIGKSDGYTLFVKGAVVGDLVLARVLKAKKTYGYAKIERLVTPSKDRSTPLCFVNGRCGGCQLQQMTYEAQLRFKENKVKACLERIGGVDFEKADFLPILGMENPIAYRNKAQFPVGTDKSGNIVTGFYAGHSHDIIPCDSCVIQHPVNEVICRLIRKHMDEYRILPYSEETGKGLVRHILTRVGFTTGEVLVCPVINGRKLPKAELLAEKLSKAISEFSDKLSLKSFCLNVNTQNSNVILGEEVLPVFGETYITDYIGEVCFRISPLSFFQVNPLQTRVLYKKALEFAGLSGKETVWDLYCGIGTISLFLAKSAKHVFGVEIVPPAIENAKENAMLNHISNADFFVGAAEDVFPQKLSELGDCAKADVVVVDPPRKGCEESLLLAITKMSPSRIVYVSCDPATLARDVKILAENGYCLEKAEPVDMFPGTIHVETVCLLSKLHEAKHHVSVKLDMDEMDLTSAESKPKRTS